MKKALFALLLTVPAWALAHPGGHNSGLLSGLWHPLSGWDHMLAMLAVGLWAASFSGKARWLIPASFVGVMVIGFVLGVAGVQIPMLEQGIAASVLVLGLAAAWAKKVPVAAAMTLTGAFALFHGVAHGAELGDHGALSFAVGFVFMTAALHAAGFGIGYALHKNVWVTRAVGSAIGLVGLGMLFA